MPIWLIGIAGFVLYIYLAAKFQLVEKYGFFAYLGLPVFIILLMVSLALLGVPLDLADEAECVKWDWATGDCTKYEDIRYIF